MVICVWVNNGYGEEESDKEIKRNESKLMNIIAKKEYYKINFIFVDTW